MSEWNTLCGFIFYVCPCTALMVWLTSKSSILIQIFGTISAILFCTWLLHVMYTPSGDIDLALEDFNRQMKDEN